NEDVKDAPLFKDIAMEILEFIDNCDFGGFNAERFDLPLLAREMRDSGNKFNWKICKVYDAQKVYHLNEKRDLTAAYKFYCNKNHDNAHSALADTEATLEILSAQVSQYGKDDQLESLGSFEYKVIADFYDDERKFRWWNGKLYMMFGKYAKKCSLQEVASKDPKYLEWIVSAKFSEEIKGLVQDALIGKFPVQNGSK
ncbi:MAG: 3'-5' exonuclease, partial [Candidatus Omnitrophica bacterium]|nr:3'-5' exonuclease [Candidatus Omnitrophota bacterium]